MKQLAPYAILFCLTAVNAEPINTNASNSSLANSSKIQQTTQSIASQLVSILDLKTVSITERGSIALKEVVIAALDEGKSMKEIRLATSQATKEVTGTAFLAEAPRSGSATSVKPTSQTTATTPPQVVMNPSEVTIDPETGNRVATVLPGESIFRLAQRVYGKENGRKYLEIFAANREKIKDINVVVEGQILVMP